MPETQIVKDCDTMIALYRQPVQFTGILESLRRDPRVDPDTKDTRPLGPHSPAVNSMYLAQYLDPARCEKRLRLARLALQGWLPYFDAIAFRGMSGALIAPPLARRVGKSLIMVRKTTKDCHTSRLVEGDEKARAYIIVDELTCSGTTQREIRAAIKEFAPHAVCLGVLEVDYICKNRLDTAKLNGRYKLVYNDPEDPRKYDRDAEE